VAVATLRIKKEIVKKYLMGRKRRTRKKVERNQKEIAIDDG
jgi:hypothetical protein